MESMKSGQGLGDIDIKVEIKIEEKRFQSDCDPSEYFRCQRRLSKLYHQLNESIKIRGRLISIVYQSSMNN